MSTYRLDKVFTPRSVAVIGASPREKSPGRAVLENLRRGGFAGEIDTAEFAILVRSDQKGHGLGWQLMQLIIAYALRPGNPFGSRPSASRECRDAGHVQKSRLSGQAGSPGTLNCRRDPVALIDPTRVLWSVGRRAVAL